MIRSRIAFSFLTLATGLIAIASSISHRAVDTFKAVAMHVVNVLAPPAKMDEADGFAAPQRMLQAAQAFYARIVKRERPTIHGTYRMCPSC